VERIDSTGQIDATTEVVAMTETEWFACSDPLTLVASGHVNLSERQHYLLAVAVCWRIRGLLIDSNSLVSLSVLEAFADDAVSPDDLRQAARSVVEDWDVFEFTTAFDDAQRAAVNAIVDAANQDDPAWWALHWATQAVELRGTEKTVIPAFANLVREIFGNPFRPAALDPAWLTSDVLALARGIYEERAFDRMPILADALQDAGCTNDDILIHCRDTKQVHVRGCWVLDLLLGKV
jgi:hypothetical protein